MSEKDGGSAFPQMKLAGDYTTEGMTLRDYFAAKAMQGIVGSIDSEQCYVRLADIAHLNGCQRVSEWIARDAYKQADAMLKAREAK